MDAVQAFLPPPPEYTEAHDPTDAKPRDLSSPGHGPWLLRRTSVHIESRPADQADDRSSTRSSVVSAPRNDEKGAIRNLLGRLGRPGDGKLRDVGQASEPQTYGTQVSIEASKPPRPQERRCREMKGLEQAASVKRWTGSGGPGEPWGKLMKDPELWDPAGDTFVYFGYQRPHPSFRVKSSILEQTKSDELISKLRDGYRRTAQRESTPQQPSQSALLGIKNVSLKDSSRRQGASITAPEVQLSHEIHFPAPEDASRIDILRHHLTTRNLFALLMNRPLVGLTFYQALVDLQERLETIMPEGVSSAQYLIRALIRIHLHNVSNDPAAAAGLLAWSENVFWKEGWREAFVHCSGMYSQLREMPEFRDISHVTCGLLERASLELRVKLQETEDRLSTFNFEDMWSNQGAGSSHASFNHFRRFLAQFYEKAYKAWPPRSTCWLTRDVILKLQKDFGSLYNYYVDPDIVWDETDHHMIRKTDQAPMRTTNHELCLERFFTIFDSRNRYPHIPNPHPLLPISVPVTEIARSQQKTPLFSTKSKALEKRILLASHEASNAILLSEDVTSNPLVEAFLRFDKSDRLGDEGPRDVRRQRWVLLYGILQVLSSISIEPPHLWFKSNVPYFLNPRMKGMPPWKADDSYEEPARGAGHAWLLPKSSVR